MALDRDKERELWCQAWRDRNLGFHRDDVHPDLLAHGEAFLDGQAHQVLVPLCGKTVDLMWLAQRGHEVVGVELVEDAVREFFRDHELEPEVEPIDGLRLFRSGKLTMVCGDIFELDRSHLARTQLTNIDRVWDRAALVALPAHLRGDYTRHLRQLVGPGWKMLLNAVEYDTTVMAGPPWSVPEEEIRLHYPGASVDLLARRDDDARVRDGKHTWWKESTYLIRG